MVGPSGAVTTTYATFGAMERSYRYATVTSELGANGVRTIALNRPDRLNAMNLQLIDDVAEAFDDANADPATKAIIFTGTGRAFCAGDDRHEHVQPADDGRGQRPGRRHPAAHRGDRVRRQAGGGRDQRLGGRRWLRMGDQLRLPDLGGERPGFFPEVSLNIFVTGA